MTADPPGQSSSLGVIEPVLRGLRDTPRVELTLLQGAGVDKLMATMADTRPNVVHYVGFETADPSGEVEIMLDPDGEETGWRPVHRILGNLRELADPRLVVLQLRDPNLLGETRDRFEDITFWRAPLELVRTTGSSVLANQFAMSDDSAEAFYREFYEEILGGRRLDEAVQQARRSLMLAAPDGVSFGAPLLYLQNLQADVLITPPGRVAGPRLKATRSPSDAPAASTPVWPRRPSRMVFPPRTLSSSGGRRSSSGSRPRSGELGRGGGFGHPSPS